MRSRAGATEGGEAGGDERLRTDVRLLGDLLGQVLVEQEGQAFLALEERVRVLAREARAGGTRAPASRRCAPRSRACSSRDVR